MKYEFAAREIMGEYILIPVGEAALAVSGMGSTNAVGAFICEQLKENCSYDELYANLLNEFDVDAEVAKADLDEFLDKLTRLGLLER